MKIEAKIQKWGNSLALRITGAMRDVPHFKEGTPVEIEISEEGLNIQNIQSRKPLKLPFSEAELLKDMTPQKAHADIISRNLLEGEY